MHHPTKERYHYCLDMEYALARLGANSQGAAMFTDQKYVKKGLLDAVGKIRKRLETITMNKESKGYIEGYLNSLDSEAD